MERLVLGEVVGTSILRTGLSTPTQSSSRPVTALAAMRPPQRAVAQRLRAMDQLDGEQHTGQIRDERERCQRLFPCSRLQGSRCCRLQFCLVGIRYDTSHRKSARAWQPTSTRCPRPFRLSAILPISCRSLSLARIHQRSTLVARTIEWRHRSLPDAIWLAAASRPDIVSHRQTHGIDRPRPACQSGGASVVTLQGSTSPIRADVAADETSNGWCWRLMENDCRPATQPCCVRYRNHACIFLGSNSDP